MRIAFCVAEDFNLGASYVIAYLKSQGHEVRLFFDPLRNSRFLPLEVKEYRPDLVCISCVTANYGWASRLAKEIRDLLSVAKVIVGGVHPTLCPEEVKENSVFDDVCVGDGIKYFGGEFDPDTLWPDREIFFEQLPPVHRAYQIFMTGFGCPFRCSYCNNHQLHRKLQRRSTEGCIKELHHLKKRGLKYVLFDDDIFTINKGWLVPFLRSYKACVALPFTCFVHTRFIDPYIAGLLKESGCETAWLGIQSGDEDTRNRILNRHESNAEIIEASEIIKRSGLKLMIDHIFGLPEDNYEKILNSYNLYKRIRPDVVNCYELLYFPKAEINKYAHENKALYQKQGGRDYQRYAKAFTSLPFVCN